MDRMIDEQWQWMSGAVTNYHIFRFTGNYNYAAAVYRICQ